MALTHLPVPKVGIPVTEVGKRIVKLNEALKANNMVLASDTDMNISFYKDENTVKSIKIEVYLLEEGDKENANEK